jgi:hypothetical protein
MSERKRIKFGNWLSSAPATVGGLSIIGWICVVVSVMLMVFCFVLGKFAAGFLALLLGLLFVALFMARFGELDAARTIASRALEWIDQKRRDARGESQYRTGIFSGLPAGHLSALPGPLADLGELDGVDGEGEPFTLLHHRSVRQLSATFTCVPDGIDLHPQDMVDGQVATYAAWIASLSSDTAIAGATVTADSAYSSKEPLVAKLQSEVAEWAPAAAKEAHAQATALLPGHFTDTSVHATVVWDVKSLSADMVLQDAAAEIAAKLPHHRDFLKGSGAGLPVVATSDDLARAVQVAYSPHRGIEQGTDELLGHRNPMRLAEAGPEYFDDFAPRVAFHDGVCSMTAMMTVPPRIHITERTFRPLFAPADRFLRKRVTVFYRPLSSGEAIKKAMQLRKAANVAATAKGMASGFDKQKVKLAEKTENDLVEGASMTAFALMATVTFEPNEKAYRDALTKLKNLLEGTNLAYRWVESGVSAAFHSTLPLGILPWEYQGILDTVAEGL